MQEKCLVIGMRCFSAAYAYPTWRSEMQLKKAHLYIVVVEFIA
jgi:hypothetical protein